jgi:TPR repeat protein
MGDHAMTIMLLAETDAPSIVPEDLENRPPRELGTLYAAGRVVPRDLVAAHMWFNIAAMRGDREAAVQRQEVAAEMSRDEIAQALGWARAWLDAKGPVTA